MIKPAAGSVTATGGATGTLPRRRGGGKKTAGDPDLRVATLPPASSVIKLAIIFHRFGPYHLARLRAASRRLDLLAIEESAETGEYAWDAVPSAAGELFARVTLLAPGERPARPASVIASRVREALDRFRPAAVAIPGWSDPAALAALDWGLANGVPAVVMSESTAGDEPRRGWKEWLKGRVVRLCASGLVGGQPHVEYLTALGMERERIFRGYDAVDNAHFAAGARASRDSAAATRHRLALPENYFLASNRFLPKKNLSFLLAAFADYRRSAAPGGWGLVLLGDGAQREQLRRERASLSLDEGALSMPGFKQYDELPAYYGLAGAFVHASTSEPWGLVVNEAMASGLPVLVSDRCGCARDLVVPGENGWTFDPGDVSALTRLMGRVAAMSPETRAGMGAASQRIVAGFSPEVFGENMHRGVEAARSHPPQRQLGGLLDRPLLGALLRRADTAARSLLPPVERPS